jgi:hypothetical protein
MLELSLTEVVDAFMITGLVVVIYSFLFRNRSNRSPKE